MGCGSKVGDYFSGGMGLGLIKDGFDSMTRVKSTPDRNLSQEYQNTLNAQIQMMPQQFKAQQQWAPQFAQLGVDTVRGMMPGIMNVADQYAYSPIQQQLQQQAQADLNQGGRLTADQLRNVQQDTRAAYNDRGLGISNPSMFAEVMNLEGARQNRLRDRQQFASGIDQQGFARRQAGISNAMQLMGYGTAQLFNPESAYAGDVYNTNYNSRAAANIATSNNRAAALGGIMKLGGSVISAFA